MSVCCGLLLGSIFHTTSRCGRGCTLPLLPHCMSSPPAAAPPALPALLQAVLMARLCAVQLPAPAAIHAARPTTRLAKCAATLASATTSAAQPTANLASCAAMCASTPKTRCDLWHLQTNACNPAGMAGLGQHQIPSLPQPTAGVVPCLCPGCSAAQLTQNWGRSARATWFA